VTLFARAKDWLPARLKHAAGVSVSYARGGTTRTLTAWVGRTVFASQLEGGPRIEFGDRDYLVTAADLALFGEPALGDRITEVVGGETQTHECVTPGTGEPAWRWSDPTQTIYRIHCKRVS
jgi:hypothetical protein